MFNTEYRLHFGSDKHQVSKENYLNRLSFRKDRSSHEQRHTPLIWVEEDNTLTMDTSIEKPHEPATEVLTVTGGDVTHDVVTDQDTVVVETPLEVSNNDKENEVVPIKDEGKPPTNGKKKMDKRRVLKSVNRKKPLEHTKPIIAYGWADKDSIQAKRTFNVLAPKAEVRNSALRAANLRDVAKKARVSSREKLRKEKERQQEVIDALTDFSQWETEYRRQFSPKKCCR